MRRYHPDRMVRDAARASQTLETDIEHEKPPVAKILRAAYRCLSFDDTRAVTMRQIASQAGVSKSLVHYYFKRKEDLLLELVDRIFSAMIKRIEAVTDRLVVETRGSTPLLGSLDAIWYELRGSKRVQEIILRLYARGTTDHVLGQRLTRFRTRLHRVAIEGIQKALGKAARPDLPIEPLAELLLAVYMGLETARFFCADPGVVDDAYEIAKLFAATGYESFAG